MAVTRKDVEKAAKELGLKNGDTVIIHSSYKSMGEIEGGAETVINGFFDAVGQDGTLVFPTLVAQNFTQAYQTWSLDKPSDMGYLTNYFRLREGSIRSDQATHSVAAGGRLAKYLTETHGQTGKRIGCSGDTAFSADSPWQKMYDMDAKTVLLGVGSRKTTFRHLAEYIYVNELLDSVKEHKNYDALVNKLAREHEGVHGRWPAVYSPWVERKLEKMGAVKRTKLGDAELMCYNAKIFVDTVLSALRNEEWDILKWEGVDYTGKKLGWTYFTDEVKQTKEELNK